MCHAYPLLIKGGLKEKNIVVFMYDDIATNELNPRHGVNFDVNKVCQYG